MEKVISLKDMGKKTYNDLKEFEEDLKWFDFFCRVVHTKLVPVKKPAKELLKFVKSEAISIQNCGECFQKAHEHGALKAFVMPCQSPHLLIWAQMNGFSFWPSKAMWIEETQKIVNVRFFGDHTTITLPAAKCRMFSKDRPTTNLDGKNIESYQFAMNVSLAIPVKYSIINMHVDIQKIGHFFTFS